MLWFILQVIITWIVIYIALNIKSKPIKIWDSRKLRISLLYVLYVSIGFLYVNKWTMIRSNIVSST